jgi:hypothetical protein
MRPWPPLTSDLKAVLVQIVLRGTPIALGARQKATGHFTNGIRPKILALAKLGCFMVIPPNSTERSALLDLTPSGWVQALCADDRVWINSSKALSHLRDKMPNLTSCWPTLTRASRKACLRILADSVRFTVSNREWFASNTWEPFERYFVLATFKCIDMTENDRERILSAVRSDLSSKDYFVRAIRELFEHHDVSAEERRQMMRALRPQGHKR